MTESKAKFRDGSLLSRRNFLSKAAATSVALCVPSIASASLKSERSLAFNHLHTGEKLKLIYWAEGQYVPESLQQINKLLRDFRTDEHHKIDPKLFDLLHQLQSRVGNQRPFEIISAYRSPKTNAMLRNASSGVAKKSLHMLGQALDIRLPGTDIRELQKAALNEKVGGVGLYTGSNFIHVDTGRVRNWGS